MADNFAFTEGSGKTGAADDIGGVLYPRVKIAQGADGSATDVSSAAPLQVSLANHGANATAVTVDGSGVTQPVSLASVPSHAVTNAGTFAVQATEADGANVTLGAKADAKSTATDTTAVTIMSVLKQISASIQAAAASLAGTLTVGLPTGASTVAKQPALGTAGTASADVITVQGIASMTALKVDGSAVTQPVSGTITANLAAGTNNIGDVDVLTVPSDPFGANADAASATGSISAKLRFIASTGIPVTGTVTVGSHAVTNAGTFAVQAASAGDIAHDAADSGNPVKVGAKAVSAEPTAVTANDRANLISDLVGKLIVLPYANPENFVSGAITSAMTGTTSTSLIAAPAAGLRNYITTIVVSNAHATVGTDVIIQDGSGGTTLMMTIPAAAVYGGSVINLPVPLRQPTTATAIYCANVTTGASTKVSAVGYKGA